MRECPLCGDSRRTDYPFKTYKTCVGCQHTYQPEPPPKTYLNPEEDEYNGGEDAVMGNHEKAVNGWLANWLFERTRPNTVLDIGCSYPYLAHCLRKMGVDAVVIDGIFKDKEPDHGLDVPTYGVNWEDMEDGGYDAWKGTDLITMIHVLEHFKNPIECLKRAYDNLSDDGALYIRSPNKDVPGIDRDHTEGYAIIHPNIFGSKSLVYAAAKAGFHLIWEEDMPRFGQTSWIFKKEPPTISLFMIVKNEEENIVECLRGVKNFVDEMIIVDTGSTDNTIKIAEAEGAQVFTSKFFGVGTEIKDFDFSKARNEAMRLASGDWLFWMDADDRFVCNRLDLSTSLDVYNVNIKYGGTRFSQARFFRNGWGVYFKGAVHEFPVIDSCRLGALQNCSITHISGEKEGRVERNLSILKSEFEKDPNNKRTLFYLANASREANNFDQAIKLYQKYIKSGGNFRDELALAHRYLTLSYYTLFRLDNALAAAHTGIAFDDRWGELYSIAGECYYHKGQYNRAISYLKIAYEMPLPDTTLFVEKRRYHDFPKVWLSLCYEKLGDLKKAREWAKGNPNRIRELAQRTYVIEVRRPGALGDVLCTTPAVRELREKYPDAHIRYVTHASSVPILKYNPHIDEIVEDSIGKYSDQQIEFAYPMHEGYPDIPMDRHLTQYFAECAKVELSSDKSVLNLLPEDIVRLEHKKPVITFAVKTVWSRYKEWPLYRWEALIKLFPEFQFIQLGAPNEPRIEGAQYMCGSLTLRESFSVLEQSVIFIGLDSVFNHASRALGVPAVIMFGSTSPHGFGYEQNTNLWSNYECSPCYREDNSISVHQKPPCPYDHKCMVDYMTVKWVAEAVREKLNIHHGSSRQSTALPTTG